MYEAWLPEMQGHTLLRREFESNNPPARSSTGTELSNTNTSVPTTMSTRAPNVNDMVKKASLSMMTTRKTVLLQMAVVKVKSKFNACFARILLDVGSVESLVTTCKYCNLSLT